MPGIKWWPLLLGMGYQMLFKIPGWVAALLWTGVAWKKETVR